MADEVRNDRVLAPIVVREYPTLAGRYRVRIVRSSSGPRATTTLDIREYAKSESFEGFTRRGIRLTSIADVRLLREALQEMEDGGLLTD